MLTIDAPAELDGRVLNEELARVGIETHWYLEGDQVVFPNLDDSHETVVVAAISVDSQRAAGLRAADELIDANRATLEDRAGTALDSNRTFLALAAPTNAQVVAQVKALTRQNNGLIRLVLGKLDGTD